jgi:hypothetical protein
VTARTLTVDIAVESRAFVGGDAAGREGVTT